MGARQKIEDIRRGIIETPLENIKNIFREPTKVVESPTIKPGTTFTPSSPGYADIPSAADPKFRGGGGGGEGDSTSRADDLARANAEAEFQRSQELLEQQRKVEEARIIERERIQQQQQARLKLESELRTAKTKQAREEVAIQFKQDIAQADIRARAEKERAGLIRGVTSVIPTKQQRGSAVVTKKSPQVIATEKARAEFRQREEPIGQVKPKQITESLQIDKRKDIAFKDIAFKESFRGEKLPTGKISPAGFFDIKVRAGVGKLSDVILSKFPEGKVKTFLGSPSPVQLVPSELVKFGIFSPAFATTTEVTAGLTQIVIKSSPTRTRFVSEVSRKGDNIFDVGVLQKTKLTEADFLKPSFSITKETVIETGKKTSIGAGKGRVFSQLKEDVTLTKFDIVGGARQIGKSRVVIEQGTTKVSIPAGEGVFGRSFSQPTQEISKFGVRKLPKVRVKQDFRSLEGFKVERVDVTKQDIFGAIRRVGSTDRGSVFKFAGQTTKPDIVSREGRRFLQLRDLNVKGTILEKTGESTARTTSVGLETITKTKLKTLPSEVQESIAKQVSAGIGQARQPAFKSVTKPKSPTPIKAGVSQLPETKIKDIQADKQIVTTTQPVLIKQDEKIKTSLKLDVRPALKQEQQFKTIITTRQLQKAKQEEGLKTLLKQAQPLKLEQKIIQRNTISSLPSIPKPKQTPPRIPIIIPPFKFKTLPKPTTRGRFGVEVRRGGKFRTIGTTGTLRQAFAIGTERVGGTLAATFRIKGAGGISQLKTPVGFKQKSGGIFIETPSLRLSRLGERREIQIAKKRKNIKRKSRVKGGKK